MAIEIKSKKTQTYKSNPFYTLTYNYMIGDSKGYTSEEVRLSIDNPLIERYCVLLNSLKTTNGYWGIMLQGNRMYSHYAEKQITKDDFDFLMATMFEGDDSNYFKTDDEKKYADEFYGGVRSDTEYSFLVFQGVVLKYTDEYGEKHYTQFK